MKSTGLLSLVIFGIFGFLTLSFNGCYYDVEEELYPSAENCDTSNITYSGFVVQTMENFCYVCHDQTNGPSIGGNVILEGYSEIKVYVDNDKILCSINHNPGCPAMPQGGSQLSTCTILKIEAWVLAGALNN